MYYIGLEDLRRASVPPPEEQVVQDIDLWDHDYSMNLLYLQEECVDDEMIPLSLIDNCEYNQLES